MLKQRGLKDCYSQHHSMWTHIPSVAVELDSSTGLVGPVSLHTGAHGERHALAQVVFGQTRGTLTPRHAALRGPHVAFTTIRLVLVFVTAPALPQVRTGAAARTATLLVHLTPRTVYRCGGEGRGENERDRRKERRLVEEERGENEGRERAEERNGGGRGGGERRE